VIEGFSHEECLGVRIVERLFSHQEKYGILNLNNRLRREAWSFAILSRC